MPAWAPASAGTALKWAAKWRRNLRRPLVRNTGKNCIAGGKDLENTSWICGRPMKSSSGRQVSGRRISISPTSAPCATAITSFHTGRRERNGEIWRHSSALNSLWYAKEKGRWGWTRLTGAWCDISRTTGNVQGKQKMHSPFLPWTVHFCTLLRGCYTSFWKYSYPPFWCFWTSF